MLKHSRFMIAALVAAVAVQAHAKEFNIPNGDLGAALNEYMAQSGVVLMVSGNAVRGAHTNGVRGDLPPDVALSRILSGTGLVAQPQAGVIAVVRRSASADDPTTMHIATASAPTASGASLETVTVTSSKIGGDVQNIPIAITALSQEQLTATQTAGGPDLVRQVPNLNFTKTNFTGYDISIRGIGTEAISVSTDPAVAVAFNDIPFIRNHFFEQEFYDVSQVEVLRGPQGTLYGRNATAGVVNLISARPTDSFEAMISAEFANYSSRRTEGMINLPIISDRLDIRVAGEWTKRQGYSFNETTDQRIDGRDLWSGRISIGFKPIEHLQMNFVWEHFSEDDDRLRSSKQLCKSDPGPSSVGDVTNVDDSGRGYLSQGCLPTSLYSPDAYEALNGNSLPFVNFLQTAELGYSTDGFALNSIDPYASTTQSRNLRVIQSTLTPTYKAKNDVVELNTDYNLTPALTLTSQTGFNEDFLRSTEDFNRFNTAPGLFPTNTVFTQPPGGSNTIPGPILTPGGFYCDPQLGCSDRLVGEDLSQEHSWQLSQEFRLASHFSGPFNFSLGGNYLHYETLEDYYVFINLLSMIAQEFQASNPNQFTQCVGLGIPVPHHYGDPNNSFLIGCPYIDPNPITSLDGNGHNYFRSINPYILNSYAGFGEAYYQVLDDLKLTGGLRWTDDRKHFTLYPTWVDVPNWGYPSTGVVDQQWSEFTGRFVANWTPKLPFTDQTMFYASYSRGYKGGGANPPGPAVVAGEPATEFEHPLTFLPEFVNAYEAGTKNTLLDGAMTFNGDVFYYDYKNYQISEIVDRTSINLNFNANVRGAEIETSWEPIPGLRFNLSGGWEDSKLATGSQSIDLMDRTAGHTDWMIVKPFITASSNCILPVDVVAKLIAGIRAQGGGNNSTPTDSINWEYDDGQVLNQACYQAYNFNEDPGTFNGIDTGFDPSTAPNGGAGFTKNLAGNQLPNAPPFTASFGSQYTVPVTPDWAATLRGDFYWQANSFARVFNDRPYDQLRGYTNVNLTLILTNQDGWQAMAYAKNIFNTTAITGDFLNSDDTGLTTNVFLTDPRLVGVRVTKNW